jgi:hypothetical protein
MLSGPTTTGTAARPRRPSGQPAWRLLSSPIGPGDRRPSAELPCGRGHHGGITGNVDGHAVPGGRTSRLRQLIAGHVAGAAAAGGTARRVAANITGNVVSWQRPADGRRISGNNRRKRRGRGDGLRTGRAFPVIIAGNVAGVRISARRGDVSGNGRPEREAACGHGGEVARLAAGRRSCPGPDLRGTVSGLEVTQSCALSSA